MEIVLNYFTSLDRFDAWRKLMVRNIVQCLGVRGQIISPACFIRRGLRKFRPLALWGRVQKQRGKAGALGPC
jgi:hypothetical protein